MKKDKKEEYLQSKIGLINATIAGTIIGAQMSLKSFGREYHYDDGIRMRKIIEKDIRNIFAYGYKMGKQKKHETK